MAPYRLRSELPKVPLFDSTRSNRLRRKTGQSKRIGSSQSRRSASNASGNEAQLSAFLRRSGRLRLSMPDKKNPPPYWTEAELKFVVRALTDPGSVRPRDHERYVRLLGKHIAWLVNNVRTESDARRVRRLLDQIRPKKTR